MKLSHLTTLPAVALALAACGGDGSPPPDPKHFSGPDDSIATRISAASSLEEAATFEADNCDGTPARDFDADTVTQLPREPMTVRLFRTSPDTLSLVIETASGEFSFGPEDADPDILGRVLDRGLQFAGVFDGNWLGYANGYYKVPDSDAIYPENLTYHVPFIVDRTARPKTSRQITFGVIGLETSPSDMPQSRTAHFQGVGTR